METLQFTYGGVLKHRTSGQCNQKKTNVTNEHEPGPKCRDEDPPTDAPYTLFIISSAVPLKIRCFSRSGISIASIDDTERSIDPSMCG